MHTDKIKEILTSIKYNSMTIENALEKLKILPYEDIGFAKIDHHRQLRRGFPEFVFCQNKTQDQLVKIIKKILKYNNVLATRVDENKFRSVKRLFKEAEYSAIAKIVTIEKHKKSRNMLGKVAIVTAGTSDISVAEEAAVTAEFLGCEVRKIYDAGVAGLHRITSKIKDLNDTDAIIVIAGMDGALPSVVSGLVDKPIISVPTSVGYGANFSGIAPLLSMMNGCSPGVAVVNIDNGFGAAYFAALMLRYKK